jgi:hypothetical protein
MAVLLAGCAGRGVRLPVVLGGSGSGGPPAGGLHSLADRGEHVLAHDLPWPVEVIRADLAANGPVALTGLYLMADDLLAISNAGTLYCLSRRDLSPRWVSTLKNPVAFPPAETPLDYVFVERDPKGANWIQVFSKRSGAEGSHSPIRLPFSASSGASATASTVYVGSLGSPLDNKTVESFNIADGSPGWGYRTFGRVVATPTVDPGGDILIVCSEDRTVTSLPANPAGSAPASPNWERQTQGMNQATPFLTKDWAFVGSDDMLFRCYDLHSGEVRWLQGTDAPIRKTPWVLGAWVAETIPAAGEGAVPVTVQKFKGLAFVKNSVGLHAFDADTGTKAFVDANADRPISMSRGYLVTLSTGKQAEFRKGDGWKVSGKANFGVFDFLPTNLRDGSIFAATADGTVLLALPR